MQEGLTADPEFELALSYAAPETRAALVALFGLDDALASLLRTTTQPAIAQIRLAWWRERLAEIGAGPPPAMPVLQDLAERLLPFGVPGTALVPIVEGWEVLVEAERLDDEALAKFARMRGGTIFAVAGGLLGAPPVTGAGEGWALADIARHLSDPDEIERASKAAERVLGQTMRWPREVRMLGALAVVARMNLDLPAGQPASVGAPRRVARMAWLRLTGR